MTVAALAATGFTVVATPAGASPRHTSARPTPRGDYDIRKTVRMKAMSRSGQAAADALRARLGAQGVVDIDAFTATPRMVARLDGLLTARSSAPPATIVLRYVAAHADVFRLDRRDLAGLRLRRDYVDIAGVHHLSWTQQAGGVPLFGNGLQAAVTGDGRLVQVFGSPLAGLHAPSSGQGLGSASAIAAARRDLRESSTRAGSADVAHRVLFATPSGVVRAWETVTMSATYPAVHVIDAATGRVLFRHGLSSRRDASPTRPAATGRAFDYFPGAPAGGTPHAVNYTSNGWLPADARTLSGNNAHAYSDVNDDNRASSSEEVRPSSGSAWNYTLQPFVVRKVSFCGRPYPCTWNPDQPYSWRVNRAQNTTQAFYFVNRWHDHLEAAPIGFTEDAGNFQRINRSGSGKGGDAVRTETLDGADTDTGLPDGYHIDNANMDTPPDGTAPRMQLYLQHTPFTSYPGGDPFAPTNVGDEADTVYHEYTHGLSNRLVVDASGVSTLGDVQAGAMGEAWSDWYAMDYLVTSGLQRDSAAPGDVVLFQFDGAGVALDRTEPIDCPVGVRNKSCPGTADAGRGGYTYGDYGRVLGFPEVHADGEIWAQTLWDLRARLGSRLTESLVTRAMELSPANPSFLDERNAIITADNAIYRGQHVHTIWTVFAHRGMGWHAGAVNGDDPSPVQDFSMPPAAGGKRATVSGTVLRRDTNRPIRGARVTFGGHGEFTATSDARGHYEIRGVPVGTYPKVTVYVNGYYRLTTVLTVRAGATAKDFRLTRR